MLRAVLLLLAAALLLVGAETSPPSSTTQPRPDASRGWSTEIDWYLYKEGKAEAIRSGKPALLLFHRTSCAVCDRFREDFNKNMNEQMIAVSKKFVMINIMDDEAPTALQFRPDNGQDYSPRVLFVDSKKWKVRKDIYNALNPDLNEEFPHYYFRLFNLQRIMVWALAKMRHPRPSHADPHDVIISSQRSKHKKQRQQQRKHDEL